MSQTVEKLFNTAAADGNISQEALQAIMVSDIGAQIQAGLGIDVDDVLASEVVLVMDGPDDSASIRFAGNAQAMRDGHNGVLDALAMSKQVDSILVHCRYLNGYVLHPYCPLPQAVKMDSSNYDPNLGTPYFDHCAVSLATQAAKAQSFEDNGVPCRTVTLLGPTDGADQHSVNHTAKSIRIIVESMLKTERHIIAAMGLYDGPKECPSCNVTLKGANAQPFTKELYDATDVSKGPACPSCSAEIYGATNFRAVFASMGVLDEWILVCGCDPQELRKAFQLFSQRAVRASQGGASFSQTAVGGFGS